MIIRLTLLSILILFKLTAAQDFKCNDLLRTDANTHLRTFEYINPKTKLRGVACASFLNNNSSVLIYLEEDTGSGASSSLKKQAVARAQKQNNVYTGVVHVIRNISDNSEDLFDLDGSAFNLSVTSDNDIGTFSIKSPHSADSLVYIWQPRVSVPKWTMQVDVPRSCSNGLKSFTIHDPIPRPSKDRHGIVCVFSDSPTNVKFYSLGWRKAGASGKPRKFVNFGSLSLVSPNYLNVYTGQIHAMEFPLVTDPKDLQADRLIFKESKLITAVKSYNINSFLLYGDLQEVWFDPQTKLDAANRPQYPILPINLKSDYSADLKHIYGLPCN